MVRFLPQGIMPLLYSLARRAFSQRRPAESAPGAEASAAVAANQ
jgi:hypothetical protein